MDLYLHKNCKGIYSAVCLLYLAVLRQNSSTSNFIISNLLLGCNEHPTGTKRKRNGIPVLVPPTTFRPESKMNSVMFICNCNEVHMLEFIYTLKIYFLQLIFCLLNIKKSCHIFKCVLLIYRVIHKSLRDFRTRLRNNQDRHGRTEHINT